MADATGWLMPAPAGEHVPDDEMPSDRRDEVFARLLKINEAVEMLHPTICRAHRRIAEICRVGRIILACDAPHLNDSIGEFGMNSAPHHSRNPCGKLVRIVEDSGPADPLLDLHERQHRMVMEEFIRAQSMGNKRALEMSAAPDARHAEEELRHASGGSVLRHRFPMRQSACNAVPREAEIA